MSLDLVNQLVNGLKQNNKIQNVMNELGAYLEKKDKENKEYKIMLEQFNSEFKDKMNIKRAIILQENAKYYVYDKVENEYLVTICEKERSNEIIKINENDLDAKIGDVLEENNGVYTVDVQTTKIVAEKINEEFNQLLEEQKEVMESRRIEGHTYEVVEVDEKLVSLIDNDLENGVVFEEFKVDFYFEVTEGEILNFVNGRYEKKG